MPPSFLAQNSQRWPPPCPPPVSGEQAPPSLRRLGPPSWGPLLLLPALPLCLRVPDPFKTSPSPFPLTKLTEEATGTLCLPLQVPMLDGVQPQNPLETALLKTAGPLPDHATSQCQRLYFSGLSRRPPRSPSQPPELVSRPTSDPLA